MSNNTLRSAKSQVPNAKSQANPNLQISMTKTSLSGWYDGMHQQTHGIPHVLILEPSDLLLGIWDVGPLPPAGSAPVFSQLASSR